MPDELQALTLGGLINSRAWEDKTVNDVLTRFDATRKEQGWDGPCRYIPNSYLHRRWVASRNYENDYTDRIGTLALFGVSNMSLGMPTSFANKHHFTICQDLLDGDNFFGTQPEGPEDQNPAVKLWERYLQRVAKDKGIQSKLKEAVLNCLKHGEAFAKITDKVVSLAATMEVRIAIQPNDTGGWDPILDSRGNKVTELDRWEPKPGDASKQILLRDPKVVLNVAAPGLPVFTPVTHPVEVITNPSRGCEIAFPYWADVVYSPLDDCIQQSDFVAHVYDLAPDDLALMLPPSQRTPAFDEYYEHCLAGSGSGQLSDAATAILRRGEEDKRQDPGNTPFAKRRYAEVWARVETTEADVKAVLRRREDITILIDLEDRRVIAYDRKLNAAPWLKDRRNPLRVMRINPVEKRAHGRGYFDELRDSASFIDKAWNREEVAISTSGNIITRDRTATEEGLAGRPLEFRSLRVYSMVPGRDHAEHLQVTNIPCEIKEITEAKNEELSRLQNDFGITTPADAEAAGLPAANTLGGVQILEKQANVRVKKREDELMGDENEGLTAIVKDFSEVEALGYDPLEADRLFKPLADAQAKAAQDQLQATAQAQAAGAPPPPPLDPAMVPADNAALLQQFITEAGDNISNCVVLQIAPKTSSAVIQETTQATQVLTAYHTFGQQFGPAAQAAAKPLFAMALAKLDVPNPDAMLVTAPPPQPPPAAPNGQQPQQPTVTPGPGSAATPASTPPPKPLAPPAGGPGSQ